MHVYLSFCLRTAALLVCCVVPAAGISIANAEEDIPPAPEEIQKLLDAGQAEIKFYNPNTNPRRFLGETNYDYSFRHQFRVDYQPVPKTGRPVKANVQLSKITYEVKLTHVIYLPESYRGSDLWKKTLTRHELDHVSISLHPRVRLLLEEIYAEPQEFTLTLPSGQELTNDWVSEQVDKMLTERAQAVFQMIPQNNKQLDRLTQHGVKPIENRAAYFDSLYQKANLDEHGFPFTGEMLTLLKSEAYLEAKPDYLP